MATRIDIVSSIDPSNNARHFKKREARRSEKQDYVIGYCTI